MVLGWIGVRCGPRLKFGFNRAFQRHNLGQSDLINDSVAVLALPASGLDEDAFLQEVADRPLYGALSKLSVPLDRSIGTPDARAVVTRLIGKEHDDLLAGGTSEPAFGASFATRQLIGWPQSAQRRANFVQVLYEISAISAVCGPHAGVSSRKLLLKAL